MQRGDVQTLDRHRTGAGPEGFEDASGAVSASSRLSGLAGSSLTDRFRFWRGRSGRRYVFSVYGLGEPDIPHYDKAVVIAATRPSGGHACIIDVRDTGLLPDVLFGGAMLDVAKHRGATELHVHLLARTATDRAALVADLMPISSPAS